MISCAHAMEKLEGAGRSKLVIWLSIAVLSVGYVAGTQPSLNPAWMRTQACLKEGRFPCKPTPIEEAKYVFYASLDDFVGTTESVFPDPSPRYLADSLIPRYFSLRSVAYTYKDGGAIGSFLPEWWRVTQALTPYLQEDELNFDLKILDIARSTGASYFILIQPKPDELDAIPLQQIVFLNEYAALIRLDQD